MQTYELDRMQHLADELVGRVGQRIQGSKTFRDSDGNPVLALDKQDGSRLYLKSVVLISKEGEFRQIHSSLTGHVPNVRWSCWIVEPNSLPEPGKGPLRVRVWPHASTHPARLRLDQDLASDLECLAADHYPLLSEHLAGAIQEIIGG